VSYRLRALLQTEGIGTIRSNQQAPEYDDDGLSSDEAECPDGSASDDEDDAELKAPDMEGVFLAPDLTPATPTPPSGTGWKIRPSIPKILTRRSAQPPASPSINDNTPSTTPPQSRSRRSSVTTATTGGKKKRLAGPWQGRKSGAYEFDADNDIAGIVMLEIHGATDLPKWPNS